mmetsp:Transcript_21023/g.48618  ORF Transcript_21023/g.48618 Transcript_21023/m.48618 type:complete len:202 (-) Transcript_21023:118-723(-)
MTLPIPTTCLSRTNRSPSLSPQLWLAFRALPATSTMRASKWRVPFTASLSSQSFPPSCYSCLEAFPAVPSRLRWLKGSVTQSRLSCLILKANKQQTKKKTKKTVKSSVAPSRSLLCHQKRARDSLEVKASTPKQTHGRAKRGSGHSERPALSLSLPSPLSVGEALLTEKTVRGVFCALSTYGVRLTDGGGRSSEWAEMYSG